MKIKPYYKWFSASCLMAVCAWNCPSSFFPKLVASTELQKPANKSTPPTQPGYFQSANDQETLTYLNQQIESLQSLRDYYKAKSARFRDRAQRYQFQNGENMETRALWKEVDAYDKIVQRIDGEILKLEIQRDAILKKQQKSSGK